MRFVARPSQQFDTRGARGQGLVRGAPRTRNQASATIQVESLPERPPTAEAQPPIPQRHEPQFDLVVAKSAASKQIAAGAAAKYTISVTNKGPDAALNVKLVVVVDLAVTSGSLSSRRVGTPYNATATAQGGTVPLRMAGQQAAGRALDRRRQRTNRRHANSGW
jgi:uncharacterized repeat protein (TIGR01451 family)